MFQEQNKKQKQTEVYIKKNIHLCVQIIFKEKQIFSRYIYL